MISFHRGKTKVWLITEECLPTPQNTTPLYAEGVHMLDVLAEEEVDHFLKEHPTIIPLFEIDIISAIGSLVVEVVTEESLPQAGQIHRQLLSYATLVTCLNGKSLSPNESSHSHSSHLTSVPTKTREH